MSAAMDPGSVMLISLVIAVAAVFFWRTVIKLMLVGAVLLIVLGFPAVGPDRH